MILNNLKKKRIGTAMALALAGITVFTAYSRDTDEGICAQNTAKLTAGVTDYLYSGDEKPGVTAGISDLLYDTGNLNILDNELDTLSSSLAEETEDSGICGYQNLGIAKVDGCLNVRKEAGTDSKVIGKMTNHDACEILEKKGDWVKVSSGKVKGYVKSEYLVTGEEAETIAKDEMITVATVNTTTLRVREKTSVDSATVSLVGEGEDLVVEDVKDDWYKVEVDDQKGYISGDYVEISQKLPTAETVTELQYGNGVSDSRVSLVQFALQFVGNPYVWGGTSLTNGIDCSGFTMQVYARYGISLPHHAASQPGYGTRISAADARPGDLFFYGSGRGIGHVGIYIGNGQIVHASNERTGIKISSAYYRTPVCVVSYL